MTPFPNGTGPANADTGPPAPHAAAGTGGTSAIGGAHGRPCLSGAAFRRFTLPALLGLLLLAAPLHADARRDNSASSGMITSTKTELQIPQ